MPAIHEQLELIKNCVEARIKSTNSRRLYYRRISFYTFMSTAILAAFTTILLGLDVEGRWVERVRVTSLVITTIITLVNTYHAFFNHKEMWIANNKALNSLYELRFDIEFYEKGGESKSAIVEEFKQTYQSILDELNQNWIKHRSQKSSASS